MSRVARANRWVTNPIQRQYAWVLKPYAVVVHSGRKSGKTYRTPVVGFASGGTFVVPLFYGDKTDWIRNISAGGGYVVRGGRTFPLSNVRIVDPDDADVSFPASRLCAIAGRALLVDLAPAEEGFGRGPR